MITVKYSQLKKKVGQPVAATIPVTLGCSGLN